MTAIILQARLDSSRLPGKALLPLNGKPVIFRVMEALINIPADLYILACPDDSGKTLSPVAEEAGFKLFCGSKENVLERYCSVIRHFGITRAIRATGDNPFVFTDAAIAINDEAVLHNADYAGYIDLPYGAGVESISSEALLCAQENAQTNYDKEHVCPFLYNNPSKFNIYRPIAPEKWLKPDLRLTIDTHADYEFAVKLYDSLKHETNRFYGDVIISHTEALRHKEHGE